jgi:hypothetical protein
MGSAHLMETYMSLTDLKPTKDPKERRTAQLVTNEARAKAAALARQNIEQNRDLLKPMERARLAGNLHTILNAAVAGGALKRTIVSRANLQQSDGKSGPLYRYTLAGEASPRRLQRLAARPADYLRLADAAAALGRLDRDQAVIDLVSGTRFSHGLENVTDEAVLDYLSLLAGAIQGETSRIAKALDLDWYFKTVDEQNLVHTLAGWEADHNSWQFWPWAIPAVPLFTEEVAAFPATWWPKHADGTTGPAEPKVAWICRQVSLGIMNYGPERSIKAVLLRSPCVVVDRLPPKGDGLASLLNFEVGPAPVLRMPNPEGASWGKAGSLRMSTEAREVELCPAGDMPDEDTEIILVTPAALAQDVETGLPQAPRIWSDALVAADAVYTLSPGTGRLARLESVLRYGRNSGDVLLPLMRELEKAAGELVDSLRRWTAEQDEKIRQDLLAMGKGEGRA